MDQQQPASQAPQQAKPDQHTLMSVLAYLGILIIIPFLMAKDVPAVKFHIKQGLLLLIAELVIWVLSMSGFLLNLWGLIQLVNLAILVLAIIGIVNAVQGKEKELPLIGSLAKNFTF